MDRDPSAGFLPAGPGVPKRVGSSGFSSNLLCDPKQVTVPLWAGLSLLKKKGVKVTPGEALASSIRSLVHPVIQETPCGSKAFGITFVTQKMKNPQDSCIAVEVLLYFSWTRLCRTSETGLGKRIHESVQVRKRLASCSSSLCVLDPMLLLMHPEWEADRKASRFGCLAQ